MNPYSLLIPHPDVCDTCREDGTPPGNVICPSSNWTPLPGTCSDDMQPTSPPTGLLCGNLNYRGVKWIDVAATCEFESDTGASLSVTGPSGAITPVGGVYSLRVKDVLLPGTTGNGLLMFNILGNHVAKLKVTYDLTITPGPPGGGANNYIATSLVCAARTWAQQGPIPPINGAGFPTADGPILMGLVTNGVDAQTFGARTVEAAFSGGIFTYFSNELVARASGCFMPFYEFQNQAGQLCYHQWDWLTKGTVPQPTGCLQGSYGFALPIQADGLCHYRLVMEADGTIQPDTNTYVCRANTALGLLGNNGLGSG